VKLLEVGSCFEKIIVMKILSISLLIIGIAQAVRPIKESSGHRPTEFGLIMYYLFEYWWVIAAGLVFTSLL
jgi:hypothetical protein